MIMLMPSSAPSMNSITIESMNDRESPNTIVAMPKPTTDISSVHPVRRIAGRCAIATATKRAPTDGAARNQPSPCGPT